MTRIFLSWDEVAVPFWVKSIPFLKWDRAKKEFDRILCRRVQHDVDVAWLATSIDRELVFQVSSIIADNCNWPNAMFLPNDQCAVIFWDGAVDTTGITAAMRIEDKILQGKYSIADSCNSLYVNLLVYITCRVQKLGQRFDL